MHIYGGAAQRHFNYFANDYHEPTADCGIEYSKTVINSANNFTAPADLAELGYYGSSIVLGSGVVQRHYFELTSGDIADYTFIADGKSVAPTESGTPSLYYIDAKKNGAAMKLYDPSTITVYKTSEPDKTMSFDYSVMDYVRLAQNDSNITGTTAFDVIKTLSWMADEAKAYFENK
ncbi:MAG: hypothetical protein IJ779_07000 [Ruminococcus sp.]|nr:hypothetical protein [Ruminococcus sp.]